MHVEVFSYHYAEEILQNPHYKNAYKEILTICENCPVVCFPGKSQTQTKLDVVQQAMNDYFSKAFVAAGWESEPLATPRELDDALKADFRKTFQHKNGAIAIQVEVEFGNSASLYRDYFKFQLSFSNKLCDIGILIVPSYDLCRRIDSGVSYFEKAARELPEAYFSIEMPILIIGLFTEHNGGNASEVIDLKCLYPDLQTGKDLDGLRREKAVLDYMKDRKLLPNASTCTEDAI